MISGSLDFKHDYFLVRLCLTAVCHSPCSKIPWPSRLPMIQPLLASSLHLWPFSTVSTVLLTFCYASSQGFALPRIFYPCSSMNSSISSFRPSLQNRLGSLSPLSLLISELQYVISFIPQITILIIHIDLLVFMRPCLQMINPTMVESLCLLYL